MNDVDWEAVSPELKANIAAARAGKIFDPRILRKVLGAPCVTPAVRGLVEELMRTVRSTDGAARKVVLSELCRAVEVQLRTELQKPIMVFRHLVELGVDARALGAEIQRLERGDPAWNLSARFALLEDLKASWVLVKARAAGGPASEEPKTEVVQLPALLPLDVASALALVERCGLSHAELELRPATRTDEVALTLTLPPDLVELYAGCDGFGRFVVPADSLVALQQQFLREVSAHVADGEDEVDESGAFDVRSLAPFEALLAIGTDHGGDTFFLDPRCKTREGSMPVLRFVHDENCVVHPEAASLGAFVAALVLQRWAQRSGEMGAWRKQRVAERARGMPVKERVTSQRQHTGYGSRSWSTR